MKSLNSLIVAGLFAAVAIPAWSQGPALCNGQLSPAQQERFSMLGRACQPQAEDKSWRQAWSGAAAAAEADALIATEATAAPGHVQKLPARESAHLQLYGQPGLTMARVGPSPVAATSTSRQGLTSARSPNSPARNRNASWRAWVLAPQVDAVARRHDIDPLLLHAVAHVESRHDTAAVSTAGARGVMQVMPATATRFGVAQAGALHEVPTNLEVSAAYLKTLQARFGNNLPLVLAAYNAGEGAVERHGRRIPPFAETQNYVKQVLAKYSLLSDAARQRQAHQP